MFRVDWSNPKVTVADIEQLVQANIPEVYDGLLVDGGFLYVVTTSPLSSGQEDSIRTIVYNANQLPQEVITQADKEPRDSDNTQLSRGKVAPLGWTFQYHAFEFDTSVLGSLYHKQFDLTDFGSVTTKFYKDESGTECTDQADADLTCIKTAVDWEPSHDYELIGGVTNWYDSIPDDFRVWVTGIPDVPAIYGGSKQMIACANLRHFNGKELRIDGRASKRLNYSATYHTNKLRFVFRHSPGFKMCIQVIMEFYKP